MSDKARGGRGAGRGGKGRGPSKRREAGKRRGPAERDAAERPGERERQGGKPAVGLGPAESAVSGGKSWAAFVILLVVLWFAFYHDVFLGGQTLASPDAVAPAGFARVGKEALDNGVYPLWNPYVFLGMPSFASLAYNPYVYPVGLAFKLIRPVMQLPMMWLLIYYLAGGLGLFLLLKNLSLPSPAAGFGAAAFMFTPNLVAVGAYGHGSQLMASMYIPFIFLLTHKVLDRGRLVHAGALALLLGLQLLRGHVQISYYTAIMIGVMTLFWTVRRYPRRGAAGTARPLGLTVLAVALALGLASVLYIPVYNYSDLSVRAAGEHGGLGVERAGMWSLSPKEMTTFLLPGMLGFGGSTYWGSMPFTDYPNYMGILALALALYAIVKKRGDPTVVLLALLGALALLMSFGRHLGPLYELAYRWLPFFKKFRVPVMVVVLLQFSVSCLAGYGLWSIMEGARKAGRGKALVWAMASVAALVLLFLVAGSGLRETYAELMARARGESFAAAAGRAAFAGLRSDVIVVGAIALAGMGLIMGFRRRAVSLGVLGLGLTFLLCVDLWRVDYRLMAPNLSERGVQLKALEEDPLGLFLADDPDLFRTYPLGRLFSSNVFTAYKVASVGGYHAAKPKLWDDWANAHMDPEIWSATGARRLPLGKDQRLPAGAMTTGVRRMLGVKYIVTEGELRGGAGLEEVYSDAGAGGASQAGRKVYRTDDWLPKAYCVPELKKVETGPDALRELISPSFSPEAYAIVEGEPEPDPESVGSALVTSFGLNHVDVEVTCESPTFLVVGELFMEGWKAYLDGEETLLYKTNFLVRGVAVPEGSHAVRMEYFDPGLALGLKLGAGCAIIIVSMMAPATVRGARSLVRRKQPQ